MKGEGERYSEDIAIFLSLGAIPMSSKGNHLAGEFTLKEGSNVNALFVHFHPLLF